LQADPSGASGWWAYEIAVPAAETLYCPKAARIIRRVKVAIVGSRHFPELERVRDFVSSLPLGATVVTGGASGVDAAAGEAARSRQLGLIKLPPRFEESNDPTASARRNQELVDAAEVVVAFWDGESAGTRKTVERALESGREIHVLLPGSVGLKLG
jgi:predicted Rossmann fold nucleotide-binding protein DprA/Smf involved in DNA uptake